MRVPKGYLPLILRVHTSKTRVKTLKEIVGGKERTGAFQESKEKNSQTDGCERATWCQLELRVTGSKNNIFRTETGMDSRRWTE